MVGRIVIGLAVLSSIMFIGGCRYDAVNRCSDVVLVQVKPNGVAVANGLPVDSISSARLIRQTSESELHAILIPDKRSSVRDIFHVMGLFAAAGAPDFKSGALVLSAGPSQPAACGTLAKIFCLEEPF